MASTACRAVVVAALRQKFRSIMRLRPLVTMLALSGLLSLAGCTGTSTDGSRFSLPTFGAPEQWEPPLDEVEAVPEAGQPAES